MEKNENQIALYKYRINHFLISCLPAKTDDLHQAMYYSVTGGGKRIRALLAYAAGEAVAAPLEQLDYAAAAVELVHAYSLIHDDLPAMDNDDLRHGKPSCHKAYGESLAILAGDALQSLAFEILAKTNNSLMITILAKAIGSEGMVLGQSLDLLAEGKKISYGELKQIHRQKTGALIIASVQLGIMLHAPNNDFFHKITNFANFIGLAFQIQDDILDVESTTSKLGKKQGSDSIHQKATYPALLGLEEAKNQTQILYQRAIAELDGLANTGLLRSLAHLIVTRDF